MHTHFRFNLCRTPKAGHIDTLLLYNQLRPAFSPEQCAAIVQVVKESAEHVNESLFQHEDASKELLVVNLDERLKRLDLKMQLDTVERVAILRNELKTDFHRFEEQEIARDKVGEGLSSVLRRGKVERNRGS